ncbi:DUF2256 domain-containing protein [Mucilaginibacter sp. SMC90]|uniref:DUF2256 domain-containing protein n=1 Tax=Mucilaginibacter sp. SMC90 TaxID=2929803 RepID=UPI00353009E8
MRGVKKENLPQKLCVTCGKPFHWRKKWEKFGRKLNTVRKNANGAKSADIDP